MVETIEMKKATAKKFTKKNLESEQRKWRAREAMVQRILDRSPAKLGKLLKASEMMHMYFSTLEFSRTYISVEPRREKLHEIIGKKPAASEFATRAEKLEAWRAWNDRATVIVRRWIGKGTQALQKAGLTVHWYGTGPGLTIRLWFN